MTRYRQEFSGEDGWTRWIQPVERGYRAGCCDCGLVHEFDFRIEEGRVQFRARRANRSTGQLRRQQRRRRAAE